jgi:hypothetical protein
MRRTDSASALANIPTKPLCGADAFSVGAIGPPNPLTHSGVESLASSLCPAGTTTRGVRNDIQSRLGISPTQYGSLVTRAAQLQADHLSNATAARSALNSMHSSAKTLHSATQAQISALRNSYANEAALPATYRSSVASLFGGTGGAGYQSFDNNAWELLGPGLGGCDPDYGCDPCDPTFDSCAGDYQPGPGYLTVYADTQIAIDPATGTFQAFSEQYVFAEVGSVVSDKGACVSVTVNMGIVYGNPQQQACGSFGYAYSGDVRGGHAAGNVCGHGHDGAI